MQVTTPVLASGSVGSKALVEQRQVDVDISVERVGTKRGVVVPHRHLVTTRLFEQVCEIEVRLDVLAVELQTAFE